MLLFVLPFAAPAAAAAAPRPAVLLAFSVSSRSSTTRDIGVSVPLAYPLLVYLLVRMLASRARRPRASRRRCGCSSRSALAGWSRSSFLVGFRVGLNVADSNVIDVGYSGVIGADQLRRTASRSTARFPPDNQHGDTYGPVTYYAYVPFEALLPWSGSWDDLPAAHAAAVVFDLLRRAGCSCSAGGSAGPTLGIAARLRVGGVPVHALVANSNTNDALVALLVLAALLAAARPAARGALVGARRADEVRAARAGAAVRDLRRRAPRRACAADRAPASPPWPRSRSLPVALGRRLRTFYDRTLGFQADRGSPFSVWGLYDLPAARRRVVQAAALALAVVVASSRAGATRRASPRSAPRC